MSMTPDDALLVAVDIIELYQVKIRESKETIGIDLLAKGFCQGEVFRKVPILLEDTIRNTGLTEYTINRSLWEPRKD